jgi:hypothetical protein
MIQFCLNACKNCIFGGNIPFVNSGNIFLRQLKYYYPPLNIIKDLKAWVKLSAPTTLLPKAARPCDNSLPAKLMTGSG